MESKNQIKSAIQTFSSGNFTSNALSLFEKLGYVTERQAPLRKKTKEEFRDTFVSTDKHFDENKARFNEWKYVDLLFQLSKEEVLKQTSLFDTKKVDSTVIETYLFFAIELSKEQYSRTELSLITREVNRLFPMPAMILFKHGGTLTLSVINRRLHKRDESKDVLEKVTQIKDINIANPHRAHIEILFDLSFDELMKNHPFSNFVELHNAWQKTLDTKELNKKFFEELSNWYFWATTKVAFPDDEMEDKEIRNATGVIRLITRLMFVWFLKEKKLVPEDLFDEKKLKSLLKYTDGNNSTYYKAILQNLFFATLNTEMGKRKFRSAADKSQSSHYFIHNLFRYENEFVKPKETLEKYFDPIPFLNGGLFECLDKQIEKNGKLKPVRIDGFSDREDNVLKVPDELFFSEKEKTVDLSKVYGTPKKSKEKVRGLIDILSSYKFTIAENTPIEEEVALDPELLGKVFENLLANYNPETQTTARKQTGSFYTPREIVNYMVDESLLAYLKSAVSISADGESTFSIPAEEERSKIKDDADTFFDPNNEIQIHRGNLPHWQQENVWYFITFRLADSIPAEVVTQIKSERDLWLKKHSVVHPSKGASGTLSKEELREYYRLFSERIETLLNAGRGSCVLKDEKIAKIVVEAFLHFNNQRYVLDEWVIMPNHVHVLVKPLGNNKLPDILHSWKSYTANEINKLTGNKGQLWMHESYDHIVRNAKALESIRNYIRQNPVKAGLSAGSFSASEERQSTGSFLASGEGQSTGSFSASGKDQSTGSFLASGEGQSTGSFSASGEGQSTGSFSASGVPRSKDASDTLEARLRNLLSYSDQEIQFSTAEREKLIHAIDTIKIIDPACGSGAFPMGILHKLVHILHKLDPKNELWKQRQIEKASAIDDLPSREAAIDAIEEAFENNELDYGRKLYLIENCIYGVDIQPIAVQISKLRFFISLIVEQKVSPASSGRENLGIRPLPNLETKFVAANTLIALEKEHANLFTNLEIDRKKEQLKKVRHDYFEARTPKRKANCREKDKQLRDELAQLLVTNHDLQPDTAKKVAAWNPYDQNASASFFDTEWMFGLKEGFDVVIGNPPYGAKFSQDEKEYFKKSLRHQDYQPESFLFFTERCFDFLKHRGVLSFIIPNTWLTNLKLVKIRKFLTGNNLIQNISHYHKGVFDAVVDTEVVIFKKGFVANNMVKVINHIDWETVEELSHNQNTWKEKNGDVINIFTNPQVEKVVEQIKFDTEILSEFCNVITGMKPYQIGKGNPKQDKSVVEGRIFDSETKKDKHYKKLLRGRDIDKFAINWDGKRWIKFGDWLAEPRHSANFESDEKIVIRQTGDSLVATLDTQQFICMNNLHVIQVKSKINSKYILALINSHLINFHFQYLNPEMGEALAEVKKETVEKLLIKKTKDEKPFIKIVDYILLLKKQNQDSSFFERLIDAMVYELYLPEAIQNANCEVLKHLNDLPELKQGEDEATIKKNMKTIEKVYAALSEPKHPVSIALQKMQQVEEVKIIEGKNE